MTAEHLYQATRVGIALVGLAWPLVVTWRQRRAGFDWPWARGRRLRAVVALLPWVAITIGFTYFAIFTGFAVHLFQERDGSSVDLVVLAQNYSVVVGGLVAAGLIWAPLALRWMQRGGSR